MGCFGYICPVCNTQIVGDCFNGGELCRLKHVRQGKLIGETVGHYNEYGGVMEDKDYRGEDHTTDGIPNPNSHSEICDSEFGRADSHHFGSNKILPSGDILSTSYLSLFGISSGDAKYQLVEHLQNGIGVDPIAKNYAKRLIKAVKYLELQRKNFYDVPSEENIANARKAECDVYVLVDNEVDDDYFMGIRANHFVIEIGVVDYGALGQNVSDVYTFLREQGLPDYRIPVIALVTGNHKGVRKTTVWLLDEEANYPKSN